MRYVKWRRAGLSLACGLVIGGAALLTSAAGAQSRASLRTASYSNAAGSRAYELYVPASYRAGTPMPLIVALHGCGETADQFRQLSGLDALAAAKGFIVVYPQQSKDANFLGCWNWFVPTQVTRGAPEPSLIAGITSWVQQHYTIDRHRTYVAGFSAGGAMAEVMAATYPDLYAAVGVGSGCEYTAGAQCAFFRSDDPEAAGRRAYQAMGAHARVVPFIIFHGNSDQIVPPVNAQQAVQAGLVTADWADDGVENHSVPSWPTGMRFGWVRGSSRLFGSSQVYTVRSYSDGHRHELAQFWLVNGMGHGWSGGNPAVQYAQTGPNESAAMYDFFMSHPMP
jgi:poly(hydroxyalkanoate) depolymerase family esterase